MKKIRIIALITLLVLSVLLISGCAVQKTSGKDDSEYERLSFDWVDKDIKEILLRKQKYAYAITDKKDIEKLIEYITDAKVINKKEIGATDGWTYAIKATAQDGEYYSFIIGDSFAKWNKDSETQIVYTVENDYFKPLIEKMDSDLLK